MEYKSHHFKGIDLDVYLMESVFKPRGVGASDEKGVIIECGASNGLEMNVSYKFEKDWDWKCINIEPSATTFCGLIKNRPKSFKNLNIALSSSNGTVDFYDNPEACFADGLSGLGSIHMEQWDIYPNKNVVKTTVPCKTYDTLIDMLNLDRVDLFILDVEGHELEVLNGVTRILPKVLVVEIDKIALSSVLLWAESNNYMLLDHDEINAVLILDEI